MVRINEVLRPGHILMELPGRTKDEVLGQMTEQLASLGDLNDSAEILQLLIDREDLMTTGVKTGFAFPHAFSYQLQRSFLTIGVPAEPVDYDSLDGLPVEYIFLLLGPPDENTMHLRALARISRLMSEGGILDRLREVKSPEAILDVLTETENNLKFATAP